MTTNLDIVRANFTRRSDIQGELRQIDEAATTENRAYTEHEEGRVTELRTELERIDSTITANLEIEERTQQITTAAGNILGAIGDRDRGQEVDTRSMGEQFIENEAVAEWAKRGAAGSSPRVTFDGLDYRAVTTLTTAGAIGQSQRLPGIRAQVGDRRLFLADLLASIPVTQGSVSYVQDQSPLADLADASREVAEGAVKPQAGITLAEVADPVALVAVWANVTRQTAEDFPQLMGYLDGRLRYALKRRLSSQIVGGDGVGANIRGLLNRTGILTVAPAATTTEARYRTIRRGIRLGEQNEVVYEAIVLNPADAEIFDLTNADAAGLHAVADIAGAPAQTAWGLTRVVSNEVAAGTALLIDPVTMAILDRRAPVAYLTDSHASNFTSNILTLLLELRAGLALFEPAGVCKVTFAGTT